MPLPNNTAGPGAIIEQGEAPKPLLEGASEYEYVTVLNPLSVDFVGLVGVSRPANMPFQIRKDGMTSTVTENEQDMVRNYGMSLKNKDHTGRISVQNRVVIPSGKTVNLLGNEAQVIVSQLVDEIMQRRRQNLLLADPNARRNVEEEVVISRRGVNDLLGRGPITVQEQLRDAVEATNQEDNRGPEFPEISTTPDQPTITSDAEFDAAIGDVAGGLSADTAIDSPKRRGRAKGSKNLPKNQ